MSRSVLALLILAAGLGLYLWLVEMPTEQKRAASEAAAKHLLDFKDSDVQAFTLLSSQSEQDVIELIRDQDGRWGIRKPKTMDADEAAVDDFLRTLLLAQVARVVDESGTDLEPYGLTAPSLTISFRLASGEQTIRFGDAGPLSATLYAMREGTPKVFLTSLSSRDVLMHSVQGFRRKQVLTFDRSRVTRLQVVTPRETVVLDRDGQGDKETWTITSPSEAQADQPEVKSLLSGLQDLTAQGFLDDPKERAATRARLGAPLATFTLRDGEGTPDRTLSLFLDPQNRRQAYAESTAAEPLYSISPPLAQNLAKGLFTLRNKQLITAEPERVTTLVIKTGDQDYALIREGADWLVDGDPAQKADTARINMFVTRVVRLQAERLVTEKPGDLKSYGLASPLAELTAADERGAILGRMAFGKEAQGLAYAMGTAMPGVFQVRPDILRDIPKRNELIAGKTEPQRKEGAP